MKSVNIRSFDTIFIIFALDAVTNGPRLTDAKPKQTTPTPLTTQDNSSDVIIAVNKKEFPAHSKILVSLSPVFAEMFERADNMGEEIERVHIGGINETVVEEMLRYMYTGKCENLDKLADELYMAADKYHMEELKDICDQFLLGNSTV